MSRGDDVQTMTAASFKLWLETAQEAQKYEALVQSLDGIVWEADAATLGFTFVSQQAERILGYPLELWFTQPNFWADHIHPDDRLEAVDYCRVATERKEDHQFEYRMIAADGRIVWLRDIVTIHILEDQSLHLRGVMVDITARKCAEEARRESEARFRAIFERADIGITLVSADARFIEVNPALEKILGYCAGELHGRVFTEITHPDDVNRDRNLYRELIEGKRGHYQVEKRYYRKDGSLVWVKLTASLVRDTLGRPLYGVGMIEDITQRKQAETELRISEERYRSLVVATAQAVWLTDAEGQVITDLPSWRALTGQSEAETRGQGWLNALHPEDRERTAEIWSRAVETKSPYETEYRIRTVGGSYRDFYVRGVPVVDGAGTIREWVGTCTDITERKQAEEALRLSESRYRKIVELAPEAIVVVDLATSKFVDFNPQALALFKLAPADILNAGPVELSPPLQADGRPSSEAAQAYLQQALAGETPVFEWIHRDAAGTDIPCEVRLLQLPDESRLLVRGTITDITERKHAENARRESEGRWRTIFDDAAVGIGLLDVQGRPLQNNPALRRILGYTEEELRRMPCVEFTHPEDAHKDSALYQELVEGKREHYQIEKRYLTKDGQVVWGNLLVSNIRDEGSRGRFMIGMLEDITARKQAEEAWRRAEDLFRAIVEDQTEMIVRWKPDGTLTFVNQAYCRTFGKSVAELVGTSFLPLVADAYREAVRQKIQQITPASPIAVDTHESLLPDGTTCWQEWTDRGLFDEQGQLMELQSVGRDITERKKAEAKLHTTAEQLRALSARLNSAREAEGLRISREIHDELGALLTGLRWDLESLHRAVAPAVERSQPDVLYEKIEALIKLTDTTVSTVRRIASELRPSVLDDLGLIEAIEWQAQQFQERTGILCRCTCSFAKPALNPEQSTALFRIVKEALTNVLRHAQATGVEITMQAEADAFVLTISDNGKGITEEELSGLRSLGLLGMRERAHLIGGELQINGITGKGTTVRVRVSTAK